MNRGEVWWVDFDPSIGGEIRKKRPAVIISNDTSNLFMNRLQVLAMTRNIAKLYPGETYVTLNGRRSKILASQLMTVSKQRLLNRIGIISAPEMRDIERAVKIQLGLD